MIINVALALASLAFQQNAFDQRFTVVQAVVRPSGAPDSSSDVPMRGVPILHRGDGIGVSFPTLAHTDWQATIAFYYQGVPLRWQNEFKSATWADLRKGNTDMTFHMAEAAGETPLLILAHEVDVKDERTQLINALRDGFPDLATTEAQMQADIHGMTDLERLANSMATANFTPGTNSFDALKLMAAAADYQLDPTDTQTTPNYWIKFLDALNTQRASGNPVDIESFGAALGQTMPPLARTILAAGNQLYNLIRTPKRVATYNFKWMPLYEDGDQYRCALPPIREREPAKTVLMAWLPVQNSTSLPSLSLDSDRLRFGDTDVQVRLSTQSAPFLAMPEARQFRLKVGTDGSVYPLKSEGTCLTLGAASSRELAQKYNGTVNASVEMQYGLDVVESPAIHLESAQPHTWAVGDPRTLEQFESGAPAATIVLSPAAHPGTTDIPKIVKATLTSGAETVPGTPTVQPNGTVSVQFGALPHAVGPAKVSLYEEGLSKPDVFDMKIFPARPSIGRFVLVKGEDKCTVEGSGLENVAHFDIGGSLFVRNPAAPNEFKSSDGKPAPIAGVATATLNDGRTVAYPIQLVDPSAHFNVAAQVVGQTTTPGLVLPRNLVSADTVLEVSVDSSKPVLTGTTQYEVRQRVATSGVDKGHVSMRAGATATSAVFHGPIRDFLPANSVGKFDMRIVSDGGTSDYIPLTVQVGGKPQEIEVVDLPQLTSFEVLNGKWRLYGTNLEFIRTISVGGQPLPVDRQSAYLEFDGKVPANAEVKLLDSNIPVGLTFSGLDWKNPVDFAGIVRGFGGA